MISSFMLAQVFGGIALIALVLSFWKNEKSFLLKYQIVSSLSYTFQYFFLGAYTGCLMNFLCMIRNVLFNKYEKVPLYLLVIILVLMITLSLVTYKDLFSLLPMIAVVSYSCSLWYGDLSIIRLVEVFASMLFIIYNIKVLAISGLVATIVEMLGASFAIFRFDVRRKNDI